MVVLLFGSLVFGVLLIRPDLLSLSASSGTNNVSKVIYLSQMRGNHHNKTNQEVEAMMTNNKRINELMSNMKSFEKASYTKKEFLQEMFELQDEMVKLTFAGEGNAETKRIWDVENFLEQKNREAGHVADRELQRFIEDSKTFCSLVRAEINGNRGEAKVFRNLDYLQGKNIILKNVELGDEYQRTELDAVVLTPEAAVIVEVKNTQKDILITENGNFYRVREDKKVYDCNIAEKMALKEALLREALTKGGFNNVVVRNVVVFTSEKRINVENKFRRIKHCFVGSLNYIIEGYDFGKNIDFTALEEMAEAIRAAEKKEEYAYSREFDFKRYKMELAELIARIEQGPDMNVVKSTKGNAGKNNLKNKTKSSTKKSYRAQRGVAVAVLSLMTAICKNAAGLVNQKKSGVA